MIKTDKSSKLAVTNQEEYLKMGLDHTAKDKVIRRQEVIEMEENLNGHSKAWANIWNSGRDHNHFDRIIASKITRSENVADMYLMFKDHKPGKNTRPTATGCSSNTLGLSNAVSEILESVSLAAPNRYNCVSSEDMLARVHKANIKILEYSLARKTSMVRKLQCTACKIMEMVDCDKSELHDWDPLFKLATSQGVPEPWEPQDNLASQKTNEDIFEVARKLTRNVCCGPEITIKLKNNCSHCGPGIEPEEPEYSLIGSDVKALFPSIKSANTGKLIREAVEKSEIEFEGFDHQKALAYIAMNRDLTSDLEEIENLLPTRKSGRTTKLKIGAIEKDWDPQDKFQFKNQEISGQDRIKLIARVVEIATRALFQNHAYRFGNQYYHQQEGGSIGDRWTGAASEIVMQDWATKYQNILENSGVDTLLLAGYVDDGRQYTTCLPLGSRFDKNNKRFQIIPEAVEEDTRNKLQGESTNQRMGRICLEAMNSINIDLEFTMETPEDFPREQLPTLDFKLWQEPDKKLNHCYYQKQVKTPYVIMARSGMSNQQKLQILANELTRRLSNINKSNSCPNQYTNVINQYTQELKNSEYTFRTAREIVISGIRGLRTRIQLRERKNQNFYREAHTTARQRATKKLVSKETWYKEQDKENADSPEIQEITRKPTRTIARRGKFGIEKKMPEKSIIKSVMFDPYTAGSELAKRLRENEEKLAKITNTKIKIVERTGVKLQDLLTKANPWKGHDCETKNCLLCYTKLKTEKNQTQDCHQRNVVYQTRCLNCEEQELEKIENMDVPEQEKKTLKNNIKLFLYIGETSRSTYERGWEHLNDLTTLSNKSHMLKHILAEHPGQNIKDIKFGLKIIRTCRTSFERQIYESVAIQVAREQHHILNSRAEYNRCSLPRLSTQLGDSQYKQYSSELELEQKTDAELDKKIRELRKIRNKERLVPAREGNAGTKRRKINNNEYVTIEENWGPPVRTTPKKKPREQDDTAKPTSKRTRTKTEQGIIRLSNIRTVENKIVEVEVDAMKENIEWEQPRDWDKVLTEHRERMEQEERELNERLEKQRRKEQGWQLYNICKQELENNSAIWKKRKEKQIEENKRLERLERARTKQRIYRDRIENKKWEEKLQQGLEKVPKQELVQDEKLTARQEKLELQRARENLWKLRSKENKLTETKQVKEI